MATDGFRWLLTGTPREVQVEALKRSMNPPKAGWAHFMEMRLGKTAVALNEFMELKRREDVTNALVICPNTFKGGWKDEVEKWGVDVPAVIYESGREVVAPKQSILIINYEALLTSAAQALLAVFVAKDTFLVVDESVRIKNHRSKLFRAVYALAQEVEYVRVLSGLPAPQSPADYWTQLRVIGAIDGWSFWPFKHTFCVLGGFKGKQVMGPRNEAKLSALLDTCSFRARRSEWTDDFMEVDHEFVYTPLLPAQEKAYKGMKDEFVAWLGEQEHVAVTAVITKYLKMRQIATGFLIDEEGRARPLVPFDKSPRLVDLKDRLATQIAHKALVVAHHRWTVEQLVEALRPFGVAVLAGAEDMKAWGLVVEDEKDRFNHDPTCRVMVLQGQAAKYGHRLMGTVAFPCLDMFFFENTYSLDDRRQIEARAQGAGQVAPLHVVDYYSTALERDILKALERKDDISSLILDWAKGGNA